MFLCYFSFLILNSGLFFFHEAAATVVLSSILSPSCNMIMIVIRNMCVYMLYWIMISFITNLFLYAANIEILLDQLSGKNSNDKNLVLIFLYIPILIFGPVSSYCAFYEIDLLQTSSWRVYPLLVGLMEQVLPKWERKCGKQLYSIYLCKWILALISYRIILFRIQSKVPASATLVSDCVLCLSFKWMLLFFCFTIWNGLMAFIVFDYLKICNYYRVLTETYFRLPSSFHPFLPSSMLFVARVFLICFMAFSITHCICMIDLCSHFDIMIIDTNTTENACTI